jgi:hypothetical protein
MSKFLKKLLFWLFIILVVVAVGYLASLAYTDANCSRGVNYIVEKYVNIIKEYDGYAIIEGTDGNKLYMYDSVILNACNINLNKMLKH